MSRTLAREAAFKALFQLDFNFEVETPEASEDLAIQTMYDDEAKLTMKKDLMFIAELVKGTRAHLADIDGIIKSHLKEGWQMSRLMSADRNILRLAIYEMKFAEPPLPKNVAINEAVELAKRYGTDDSSRFVNGILEAISK
jgi:N utilization substance protein B